MPVKHSVMIEPISEYEFHQTYFMVLLIILPVVFIGKCWIAIIVKITNRTPVFFPEH